jgi:AcrR family transcriptional regulator
MGTSRIKTQLSPLYSSLPHGPNGMQREDVARHQRARLYGATIESVSQRGYQATTVAHVIALAGVSRRAFYEQFLNKEDCFLATYDIVVARERKRVIDAWLGQRGWANRLHAALRTLIDDAAEAPKGPRLVLVDSLGLGPRARERLQIAGVSFERLVATVFQDAPDGIELPAVAPRAIVGGIRHLAFRRLREGRERELQTLTGEVLDWIESYCSPAAGQLAALGLPRPRQIPPRPAAFLGGGSQRSRALGALVHLTLEHGYAQLTDVKIAHFAGLSTEAFHAHFRDKQDCFLTVLDEFAAEALGEARSLSLSASSWQQAVHRAIGAYLDHLLGRPALARIAFVELFELGPAMIDQLTGPIDGLTDLLSDGAPPPRHGAAVVHEALTGALWSVIASYVANDRLAKLPCLLDQLTFIVLAPHLGAKGAVEAIQSIRKPLRAV